MPQPPRTYAETVALLAARGAVCVRKKGSHEQWRLPTGHVVTLVHPNGRGGQTAWTRRKALNRWRQLRRLLDPGKERA